MPSFFETIGRIVSGRPAFVPEDNLKQQSQQAGDQNTASQNQAQPSVPVQKVIKKAQVVEVECHDGGAGMECWITIANESNDRLDLNNLDFLSRRTDLQTILNPGEERKFRVYQGPHLTGNETNVCNLEYIDSLGDYFVANHNVLFRQDHTGKYEVDRINLNQIWDR